MYWIDCKEQEPKEFQEVAFICKSRDKFYNKKRMGGMYQGKGSIGEFKFSTPGCGWEGSHWMPLPEMPPCNCGFQHDLNYN